MPRGEDLLDTTLGEMWSFVAEAFCFFLNNNVELDDELDTTVLLDYLNCTGVHVSNVVKSLWTPMRSDDDDVRASAAMDLTQRGVPDFICVCATDPEHIAELAIEAIARGTEVWDAFKRRGIDAMTLDELDFALAHLDTIVYMTDPDRLQPHADTDPDYVRYYDEAREACRRDVEESRELLRAQLQAASN